MAEMDELDATAWYPEVVGIVDDQLGDAFLDDGCVISPLLYLVT